MLKCIIRLKMGAFDSYFQAKFDNTRVRICVGGVWKNFPEAVKPDTKEIDLTYCTDPLPGALPFKMSYDTLIRLDEVGREIRHHTIMEGLWDWLHNYCGVKSAGTVFYLLVEAVPEVVYSTNYYNELTEGG